MELRILTHRPFAKAARKLGLTDAVLVRAVREIEDGLVDARLDGFLLKKRIGIDGRGKSGGLRTILAYRQGSRVVFLHVFGKSERDNITAAEQQALSELGDLYMGFTTEQINGLILSGILQELR